MTETLQQNDGHIAITSLKRHGKMRLPTDYVHTIEAVGGRPRVFSTFIPPTGLEIPDDMDVVVGLEPTDLSPLDGALGLLLPGGGDIDPDMYGRPRHPRTHNVNRRRDRFEYSLLREALDRDLPVLAICRGMQLLNVVLGGTLEQNLADDAGRLDHYRDRPRAEPAHGLKIKDGSVLEDILGGSEAEVNSHHHQGLDDIAAGLEEIAWADDGVLEAVVAQDHSWVLGVQWHPEVMAPIDPRQRALFRAFVEVTQERETLTAASARSA